jgi:hypothetical protein
MPNGSGFDSAALWDATRVVSTARAKDSRRLSARCSIDISAAAAADVHCLRKMKEQTVRPATAGTAQFDLAANRTMLAQSNVVVGFREDA